jgi:hypothetical protein
MTGECELCFCQSKTRKTLTKTRKFVVNGVVMTSQTSRVVGGDDHKKHQEHELWYLMSYLFFSCNNSIFFS